MPIPLPVLRVALPVPLPRLFDHRGAEIDPNPVGRFDCRQQVSETAPYFQHSRMRRDEKREVIPKQGVIMALQFVGTKGGTGIVECSTVGRLLFVRRHLTLLSALLVAIRRSNLD